MWACRSISPRDKSGHTNSVAEIQKSSRQGLPVAITDCEAHEVRNNSTESGYGSVISGVN